MTTKLRIIGVVAGVLSGGNITAVFTGLLIFIMVYLRGMQEDFPAPLVNWALLAGMIGGAFGFAGGLVLGLFLGLLRRGSLFGALSGGVAGIALIAGIGIFGTMPEWKDTLGIILVAGVVPVGVLSGFFTSFFLSAITSLAKRTDDDNELLSLDQVLSRLEQNKANESYL